MTLLVSWSGVDPHGTTSVYIASDSRVSWGSSGHFDLGRKVFAFSRWPDALGYCGDVLFPSIALNQIVELADSGLLFDAGYSCKEKFVAIVNKLNHLFEAYPEICSGLANNSLSVIHASRDPIDNKKFFCHEITWEQNEGWRGKEVNLPARSGLLFALGSGAAEFRANFAGYERGPGRGTSRNVFHCFCSTLAKTKSQLIGGAPQVVGIYRKPASSAKNFGIIHKGSRFFLGARIDNLRAFSSIEWRNDRFEICDGKTKAKMAKAQAQPDPMGGL